MSNKNIEQAKFQMKKLEELRLEVETLKNNAPYLPDKYNETEIKKTIRELTDEIDKLNDIKIKIELLNQKNNLLEGQQDTSYYEKLDDIIHSIEELLTKKDNYFKYKELNDRMETYFTEAVLSITESRGDIFSSTFDDEVSDSISISSFINMECIRNENINKPFMVALLTMNPDNICDEIFSRYKLTDEQKYKINSYISRQKNRIDRNLILSDKALVNLLEVNTGKNILEQERINSRYKYDEYCEQFSNEVFGQSINATLIMHTSDEIFNAFNDLSPSFKKLSNLEKHRIKERLEYLKNNLLRKQAKYNELDYKLGIFNPNSDRYNEIHKNSNAYHSLDGKKIKRFSNNSSMVQFTRTIEDMRLANFSIAEIEEYIFECFSSNKISDNMRQQLIAITLDNLELCYELFNSYNKDGSMNITSNLHISTGEVIPFSNELDESNLSHILGIPSTHRRDKRTGGIIGTNLPIETLKILELNDSRPHSALEVLHKILKKKENIINDMGCFTDIDGVKYELLPWEKIILKVNAFIRGDFFKTTSLISGINNDSYLIEPNDGINAVSLSTTLLGESAINQKVPSLKEVSPLLNGGKFTNGYNSLLQKNKDLIIKGLMTEIENDRIKRIKSVKTNETFVGERIKKENGIPVRTLNKPSYLLENANPDMSGIVISVENPLGYREYSIDEQILLLEDLTLNFENNQNVINMVYNVIEQMEKLNGKTINR